MAAKKPKSHPWRENLETLTGAIVLALIFKAFVIEISRIPSPSMQPTLMGSPHLGLSDRVLVDKLSYRLREPKRWEIAVFKHPLERSRNMVKRVVGLSGEEIRIENGDLWIRTDADWAIPRRTREVQAEMLKALDREEPRISSWRVRDGGESWKLVGREIEAMGTGRARFRPDQSSVFNVYDDGYPDAIRSGTPPPSLEIHAVGDLRLTCDVRADAGCEVVAVHIAEGDHLYRFVLPGPAAPADAVAEIQVWSEAAFHDGGSPAARSESGNVRLEAGDRIELAAQNIDDRLTLEVDGDSIVELDVDPVAEERSFVELHQAGVGANFEDIQIYRDVHYLPGLTRSAPTSIPEGHYYMLGDNTQGSADSREWVAVTFAVEDEDAGSVELRGNFRANGENPAQGRDRDGEYTRFFRDEWGERHQVPSNLAARGHAPHPTVPRHLIRGRALAIFWPIRPTLGVYRVGWLH